MQEGNQVCRILRTSEQTTLRYFDRFCLECLRFRNHLVGNTADKFGVDLKGRYLVD